MGGLDYSKAGVDTGLAARETGALARVLAETALFRTDVGRSVLPNGYYASALRLTDDLALGLCTDGVGSKLLVAEMLGKYDTVGIDCIAMNVNDLVCIGAEPIALVDYIGVEHIHPGVMEQVAEGLLEGARQAHISIPGGETAQLPDIIRGAQPGHGIDLVGTAVGVVPMERLNDGSKCTAGDLVIGVPSSGVHSNGLTLARKAIFERGGMAADTFVDDLGCTAGEAILTPTRIYVRESLALFDSGVDVHALCHITGDGLLNLNRVAAQVGFKLDRLPDPDPIFDLIQKTGDVSTAEMYTVFNMGVGMCAVVPPADADRACEIMGGEVIGSVVAGPDKGVELTAHGIAGCGAHFE
ncbi:MAG: phosphoribosylformylglycinamidine cyclo-ligase [Planctomycetota bacterium]|jgi:phosphoribosylformylglycinamidine cyclo-ligase